MNCPKCGVEIELLDEPTYGKVYLCEECPVLVIELVKMIPQVVSSP